MAKRRAETAEIFRNTIRFIFWDWSALLIFILSWKFLLLMLIPLQDGILSLIVKKAGTAGMSGTGLLHLLMDPGALVLAAVWLLILACSLYVEIAGVLLYFEGARNGSKRGPLQLLSGALRKMFLLFIPDKALMIPYLILLLPFTGFAVSSEPLRRLELLESMAGGSAQTPVFRGAAAVLFCLFALAVLRHSFAVPEVVLENGGFRAAARRSRLMLSGNGVGAAVCLALYFFFCVAAAALFCLAVLAALFLWAQIFYSGEQATYAFWFVCAKLKDTGSIFVSVYTIVGGMGILTSLYHQYHGGRPACVKPLFSGRRSAEKRRTPASQLFVLAVIVLFYMGMSVASLHSWTSPPQPLIVAHRAGAETERENTLAALRRAQFTGAQTAEIDVRQTKDGELVVLHDDTLFRTEGVDRRVSDLTLAELKALEAGLYGPLDQEGERIPELREMVSEAKGRIELMIELKSGDGKTAENGRGMAEEAVNIIRRYGGESWCSVASMHYGDLKKVKELEPALRTVYITREAPENLSRFEAADAFSVGAGSVTAEIVDSAHEQGKAFYAWTVNGERDMRELIRLGVDGIVTDEPKLAGFVRDTIAAGSPQDSLMAKLQTALR